MSSEKKYFVQAKPASCSDSDIPTDAAACDDLGQSDGKPVQPKLQKHAPKQYGTKQRDFQSTWYSARAWLEFPVSLKAAFCYCCRHFSNRRDPHFTITGFSNWQHALEKNKGFSKHAASSVHIQAMAAWKEKEKRTNTKQEISTLVNERQLEKNQYYITSIVEVIQFLCVNKLPLRGDRHCSIDTLDTDNQDEPFKLFLHLFEYTLAKDAKLQEVFNSVTKNYSYTSAMVQNEIISILKEVVLKDVLSDVNGSDIPYFTVKADGTRDPTNTENISVVVRFVKQGKVHEVLIDMTTSIKLDADALTTVILESLERSGLNPMNLLSQCYDGASVMAGKNGGLQKKIKERLGKQIPYVDCFSHKLHLVVVHAIGDDKEVEKFFSTCNMLYNFFRRPTMHAAYEGQQLQRLLEQRWTGHLATTMTIIKNRQSLIDLLQSCEDLTSDLQTCIEATGLLKAIRSRKFLFIAYTVQKVLLILQPADKLLQSRECDIHTGIRLISTIIQTLKELHEKGDETFPSVTAELAEEMTEDEVIAPEPSQPKRRRKLPSALSNSVVLSSVGQYDDAGNESIIHKSILFGILDNCTGELEVRCGESNNRVLSAIVSLWPESEWFLEPENIKPLAQLLGLDADSVLMSSELAVAKASIQCQGV